MAKAAVKDVAGILKAKNQRPELFEYVTKLLELKHVMNRDVSQLSGGELQRFALGMTSIQKANVYMFDEPSSYLDVKQRLHAAELIRSLLDQTTYVICVEHDLSVLDYLSDFVCILYGAPRFMVW